MSLVRRDEATKTSKNDQKSKACRYRRRPRGPVNIGSRSTCATALWHRISFENSLLAVDVFGDFLVIFDRFLVFLWLRLSVRYSGRFLRPIFDEIVDFWPPSWEEICDSKLYAV